MEGSMSKILVFKYLEVCWKDDGEKCSLMPPKTGHETMSLNCSKTAVDQLENNWKFAKRGCITIYLGWFMSSEYCICAWSWVGWSLRSFQRYVSMNVELYCSRRNCESIRFSPLLCSNLAHFGSEWKLPSPYAIMFRGLHIINK